MKNIHNLFGILSFDEYSYYPYHYLSHFGVNEDLLKEYLLVDMLQFLHKGNIVENAASFGLWQEQAWDTKIFGFPVGRIYQVAGTLDQKIAMQSRMQLLKQMLQQTKHLSYLTCRVRGGDIVTQQALEKSGFIKIDSILWLLADLQKKQFTEDADIRIANENDVDSAMEIARTVFRYSRFYKDIITRPKYGIAHAQWAKNCIVGSAADQAIVAEEGNKIVGFSSYKIDELTTILFGKRIGFVVLVGVDEAYVGKGWGTRLVKETLRILKEKKCDYAVIDTQVDNLGAINSYMRAGFEKIVDASDTFRYTTKL